MLKLPNWIGIGCVKCGTSWTWRELKKHPQLFAPTAKEIHFFNSGSTKSMKWYSQWFKGVQPGQLIGEFTPDYFHHYEAMHRIKEYVPNAKLIVCFRHPVERAFSNWKHALYEKRLKEGTKFDDVFKGNGGMTFRIRDRSIYSKHLKQWWAIFPKSQIKVMWYEDIKTRPVEYLQEIYRFLGVDDTFVPDDHQKWFKFHYHKDDELNEAVLEDKSKKMWLEYYKPYTEELEALTGKDLSHWKQ